MFNLFFVCLMKLEYLETFHKYTVQYMYILNIKNSIQFQFTVQQKIKKISIEKIFRSKLLKEKIFSIFFNIKPTKNLCAFNRF